MKKLKKLGWIFLGIVGLLAVVAFIGVQRLKPDYAGEKQLSGLSQTAEVYYDSYGIPHIYGENEEDAFRALGYVHAQDRLWQMELLRRVSRGGLSEVFGRDLLPTDRFFISLGIDDATVETLANLDKDSQPAILSQAYLDGINQFVDEGPTPVEFYLTGLKKEAFTIRDIYNVVGYMAFSFAMAHKTDPLITEISGKLGPEYLKDLQVITDSGTVRIQNYPGLKRDSLKTSLGAMVARALEGLPVPQFVGSNSWVIGPEKTKHGKVILANDPHIGFAQPSVWYEAHISTPAYEKYGYHLAGVPFPLLGHDHKIAYGITMLENDDIDFYFEETDPNDSTRYRSANGWETYETVAKNIKVKDADDVTFTYQKTAHGPVLNGIATQIKGEKPISMSWTYTKLENRNLEALYRLCHADDKEAFREALTLIHAPGLNLMYGDAQGNYAWWGTAKLYQMPEGTNTKQILNGSGTQKGPVRFLDFSENPHAVNPPWNYVYSANNQPDSVAGMLYPGYYLPENRAKRIVALLNSRDDWDRESVGEMINDITSSVNPAIVHDLARLIDLEELSDDQSKLLDTLNAWKGDYPLASIAATVFHRWIYYLLKDTFEDELGEELFNQFLTTHFHKRLIAPLARNHSSVWWDNTSTEQVVETQKDIVTNSLIGALESLKKDLGEDASGWAWGTVHTLEHGHPIGRVAALRSFFNVGPFPVNGSREVINNMAFSYGESSSFNVNHGPSTRRVIDFSDIENSMSILPTGQSGNPFSPHYDDQAEMFVNGQFRKMMMNKEEIIHTSKSLLIFRSG